MILSTNKNKGVNSRVSDAYDWIRATVCALSNYPPDGMCNVDDDTNTITTKTTIPFVRNIWNSWICQGLFISCSIMGAYLLIEKLCCTSYDPMKDVKYRTISSSHPSPVDELTMLKRHRSWTKMRSYDSTDIEISTIVE